MINENEKVKIFPIMNKAERHEYEGRHDCEVIGIFVTTNEQGESTLNVGYPRVAAYNQAQGNMFGFTDENGMYFIAGDLPDKGDRPTYIVTMGENLTLSSYSQVNASIVGEFDLIDTILGRVKKDKVASVGAKRA